MGNIIPIRPIMYKTECQVCKDGYADENFMIGYCCGLPLIERPYTAEEYRAYDERQQIIQQIIEESKNLKWD